MRPPADFRSIVWCLLVEIAAPLPPATPHPGDMQAATHRQGLASARPQWGTSLRTQHKGLGLTQQPARQVKPATGRPPQFRCGRPLGCGGAVLELGVVREQPAIGPVQPGTFRIMRQAVAPLRALISRCQAGPAPLPPPPLPRRQRSYHALPTAGHPLPVVRRTLREDMDLKRLGKTAQPNKAVPKAPAPQEGINPALLAGLALLVPLGLWLAGSAPQ